MSETVAHGLQGLQHAMYDIFVRAASVDLRAYEVATASRIVSELVPPVFDVLQRSRSVLDEVLVECEHAAFEPETGVRRSARRPSELPFERAMDAAVAAHRDAQQVVEEVAFIAQLELRQRYERLSRVQSETDPTLLLGEADSSLRRARKALTAVDAAIAKSLGSSPLLVFTSELQTSLAVRREYARLRARLDLAHEPTTATVYARLRAVGTQVAMLVGRSVYPELRVRDRLLLRDLQRRVLDWLRDVSGQDGGSGLRLWQDVQASIDLLSLVNRRQELLEHDTAAVSRLLQMLSAPDVVLDDAVWTLLEALEGCDADLDALLAARCDVSVQQCVECLTVLSSALPQTDGGGVCW